MPTVLMAFLSMMVFYLPCEASEKITLAISILLALVVFLLLVSKILPPTSSTIPLMAKYLLMTFVMNMITIMVTVVIINVYFRGPATHTMPNWVRTLFLRILPPTSSTIPLMAKYLLMTFVMNMITIMVTVVIINVYFRGPATHTMPNWVRTLFLRHLPMLLIMRRPESTEQELRRAREARKERRGLRGVISSMRHQELRPATSCGLGDVEEEAQPSTAKQEEVSFTH
ncbi:unnamed protein product [Strongylus vulgaris]|uniref:Neurotransmitter-gated ion-channel transmembrane domain-containing protein n=1 Tax=Strongylus vulgaris TaxID=40348 RepID=A0A3P7J751_STRVU|nr:unnamed protein product [Strongylus vulgaris]